VSLGCCVHVAQPSAARSNTQPLATREATIVHVLGILFFLRFKSNTENNITFKVSKLISIFTNVLVTSRSSKREPCCYVSIKNALL
jgi:hypothetical protein